jgi:hypothetical protein
LQFVLRKLHAGQNKHLGAARLTCKRVRTLCDALITSHALTLDQRHASWQLPILKRFLNLRDLHLDLRRGCTEREHLYALLANVVLAVPELHTLNVLCGLTNSDARLSLPLTGAPIAANC